MHKKQLKILFICLFIIALVLISTRISKEDERAKENEMAYETLAGHSWKCDDFGLHLEESGECGIVNWKETTTSFGYNWEIKDGVLYITDKYTGKEQERFKYKKINNFHIKLDNYDMKRY